MHADNPNHGPALLQMNNGTILPTRPSMGAWFLYGLGTENENLPGYVVLCPGRPVRFSILWNSAFLPSAYQGTYINHSEIKPDEDDSASAQHAVGRADAAAAARLCCRQLNASIAGGARAGRVAFDARIQSMETAFRMQFKASDAFDLKRESKSTAERLRRAGTSPTAACLARRLVERGVRFVQVYYGNGQPWDTHSGHERDACRSCARTSISRSPRC